MNRDAADRLIQAMQQPAFYDHPVARVERIETHISWVFLAGDFAYKIKKPVNFGFLDFSSLAKRQHFCQEELRLNRRFAPQLYLAVKTIGGDPAAPALNAQPPLEYAVKMQRFPQAAQLDRLLAAGLLQSRQVESFATYIAERHQAAPIAERSRDFGSPRAVIEPTAVNFAQIRPLLPTAELQQLEKLEQWSRKTALQLEPLFQQRKAAGFIRECHGDVHLANMAWLDEQPLLFDCIEFNENLRWIDVISDIAFLVMDLDDRGKAQLGRRFLNRYLQESGDYQGLPLLRFYQAYRAMVRAKVTCLRLAQPGLNAAEHAQDLALYHSYLALADRYTATPAKALIITHGLSGSGKSSFARELADHCGAIHLQSDRERKRLHGLAATAVSHSPLDGGIYTDRANRATYERLRSLAEIGLAADYPVIVDATFLQKKQRNLLRRLAAEQQVPLLILDFPVPEKELQRRLRQRAATGDDPSEGTLQVLVRQLTLQQPLSQTEQQQTLIVAPASTATELATQITTRIS